MAFLSAGHQLLRLLADEFLLLVEALGADLDVFAGIFDRLHFLKLITGDLFCFNFFLNVALWLGLRGLLIFCFFEQVLWLAIEITLRFLLGASVAANSPSEVVVLALAADPATVWECKVLLFPFV